MATNEERMRILKMVEDGKLTPEEAARMLTALSGAADAANGAPRLRGPRARFLRIHIEDPSNTRPGGRVNVRLPIPVVGALARVIDRYAPADAMQGVDIQELWKAIEAGEPGRIVDIHGDEGEVVEITLE
jgi:hypothetical protein